jgi:serine/threonine protein kinase
MAAKGDFVCPIFSWEAKDHYKHIWSTEPPEMKPFYNLVLPKMAFSLEDIMQKYLFLDYETVTKITIQSIMALRDIHTTGYAHCDLKPANFMFVKELDKIKL